MRKRDNKAKIILIGCGPHARRVYLPALHRISNIKLELIIDLESQGSEVHKVAKKFEQTELWLIQPFTNVMPAELAKRLSNFVREKEISGVIIATEPLVHKAYAEWALQNGLNILNVSSYFQTFTIGIIIVIAVIVSNIEKIRK